MQKEIKFYDMFGGVGGFRLGLERNNRAVLQEQGAKEIQESSPNSQKQQVRFACVGYCEIDKYAVQCYNENFGESHTPTDVRTIDWSKEPDFDLLCAGFPCQAFSVAGKRGGFEDTRGTLFFEVARCLEQKQPPICLLENVKGLLSHDKGRTFETILATLDELGYDAEWQVLNSKDFGVPQNRERVFIFGTKRDKSLPQTQNGEPGNSPGVQPTGEHLQSKRNQPMPKQYGNRRKEDNLFPIEPTGGRVVLADVLESEVDEKYFLSEQAVRRLMSGLNTGSKQNTVVVADRYRTLAGKGNTPEAKVDGNTYSITSVPKDNLLLKEKRVRRLTPTECERLQGFLDGWTAMLSDTRRYKAMGNAVTVNVIEAIGKEIIGYCEGESNGK